MPIDLNSGSFVMIFLQQDIPVFRKYRLGCIIDPNKVILAYPIILHLIEPFVQRLQLSELKI